MSIAFYTREHFLDSVYSPGTAPSDSILLQSGPSYAKRSYGPGVGQFASETALSIARNGTSSVAESHSDSRQSFSLTILPFTQVHLTGTYMMSVERTGSDMASVVGRVGSGMSISQWSFDSNGIPTTTFRDDYSASIEMAGNFGNESKSGQFDLVYTNNSNWTETIHYFASNLDDVSMGSIEPGIPPVPEPDTYAMLGMGLLVLGAAARRRQRRAALQAQGAREPG
ncbi:PEP-CTERM sorting domain-containing protein [Massilia sp. P8910]|uniref:PEP-CTERM sorting domain-containing protein n=1 Tax=Massilia antarctica TaxID=2765360 RepID=UPI001E396FA6|nr:PEP-CTERM sorting domain-containing protein [Massilia antarctica]MCE3604518.1 PEP-CTERM sorting domain-containing protein [Massilia antarctica]